ncbi:MBL fold metallo-hydrolase [Clostridium sp. E02]|uniref:MBL fold metallo-hydrolase n=1 Tax=Clostridium sp. E02 TaxID=2487134 RepID=UPI000F52FCE8|nr:MBL fold metallo-hydrolase [Clostridium sp. E02]
MVLKVIGSSSKGNGYALIADNEILLLECGCPFKDIKKAIDWQILKIKGCLLTHGHADHSKYTKDFQKAGIPVYTNDETKQAVGEILVAQFYYVPEFRTFHVGGFKCIPFYVPHNGTPNYGYLIEHKEMGRMLFITDYEYIPYNFQKQQVQHFLIEANYQEQFINKDLPNYEHKLLGHASLETCIGAIKANQSPNLRTVIMCHLGAGSSSGKYFTNEMQKVTGRNVNVVCAVPGIIMELNKDPF